MKGLIGKIAAFIWVPWHAVANEFFFFLENLFSLLLSEKLIILIWIEYNLVSNKDLFFKHVHVSTITSAV